MGQKEREKYKWTYKEKKDGNVQGERDQIYIQGKWLKGIPFGDNGLLNDPKHIEKTYVWMPPQTQIVEFTQITSHLS